jgi:hypothetical protein
MSSAEKLRQIAALSEISFDEARLTRIIRSYSKTSKMIGIAALCKANQIAYSDEAGYTTLKTKFGNIKMPKDKHSDAYRLQEAAQANTRGGKGMICLPAIDGIMVGATPGEKWAFKEAWDLKEISETTAVWGGSFTTKAEDYDDGENYAVLGLEATPHYYNVLLTMREKREFQETNPGLAYVECEQGCLAKKHWHGVHGRYAGAVVGGVHCAPPYSLLKQWKSLPLFEAIDDQLVKSAVMKAKTILQPLAEVARKTPEKPAKKEPADTRTPGERGSEALKTLIDNPQPWEDISTLYRSSESADWASSKAYCNSGSGQKKLKMKWNKTYEEQILPLLEGEGTLKQEVLKAAWDADPDKSKKVATYIMRRLTSGDSGVVCDLEYLRLAEP